MKRRFLVEMEMNEGEYLTPERVFEAIERDFADWTFPGKMSVEELDI